MYTMYSKIMNYYKQVADTSMFNKMKCLFQL